ncbi:HNH endonuclease [Actinomadura sp. KC216]|uniref:HNH endonuclease n=1 Tax=Actinomadura sp. KC216 TaxID=2530370 RepID=UPI001044EF62|nr:HNH endonuclease [Actinomadura sp. KC216]TDB85667.1 HNH endonuclease [Actinomadura sp. KC216]
MSGGKRPTGPNAAKRRHLKRQLAARDGASCFYCGHPFAALADATIDHLIPYSIWPTWRQANLVLACGPCNHAKADRLPQTFLRPSGLASGLVPVPSRAARVGCAIGRTARRLSAAVTGALSGVVSAVRSGDGTGARRPASPGVSATS